MLMFLPDRRFKKCPRCGDHGLEPLHTYAHCVNCNYFEDYTREIHWDLPFRMEIYNCK
jgi:hypothetical protein